MPDLAKMIDKESKLALRMASVTSVQTGSMTIQIGGDGADIAGVKFLSGATLVAGNICWVLQNGTDLLIIGKVGAGPASTATFSDGLELYHGSSTPYIDFHRAANPAGDSSADYNVRLINDANSYLHLIAGSMIMDGWIRTNPTTANGETFLGAWTDGNYGLVGSWPRRVANSFHYVLMFSGSDTNSYLSPSATGGAIYLRQANNGADMVQFDSNGWHSSIAGFMKDNNLNMRSYNDTAHRVNYDGGSNGVAIWSFDRTRFVQQGSVIMDVGGSTDGFLLFTGWLRNNVDGHGWYNNARGAGQMATNSWGVTGGIETQNSETIVMGHKTSQAGYATAGLQSVGTASMVPYVAFHEQNSSAASWRKDAGQSYLVCINSGGGCDQVFGSGHPTCSEQARKHNITPAYEYGLKTIRKLVPQKFQYKPTDESEIWSYEMWKHHRSQGKWKYSPNDHSNWDNWHLGYMAEEVMNLVPEVIGWNPDGKPKGIDYGNLVVVAIAAINELADRLEDIEARMASRAA